MNNEKDKQIDLLKDHISNLQQLLKVSETILTAKDLTQLLHVIMAMTEPIMKSEASSLLLLNEETNELEFAVATGVVSEEIKKVTVKLGQGISGWVGQTGEALISNDPYNDPRFDRSFDDRTGFLTRSYMCMPLKINKDVIGTILVLNKMDHNGYTPDDMRLFRSFCNLCAIAIRNHQINRLESDHHKMTEELEYAHSIQQGFLPKEFPQIDFADFDAINIPANQVGGDLYDVFQLDNKTVVCIGDVSGKGISAALFMSRIASDLRFFLEIEPNLEHAIGKVNNRVAEKSQKGMFLTLCVMVLEENCETATIINAGHVAPILIHADSSIEQFEIAPNPPLGILPNIQFQSQTLNLKRDTKAIMITDGVSDLSNPNGDQYGMDRFFELLKKYHHSGNLVQDLIRELDSYADGASHPDDITFVLTRCHHVEREFMDHNDITILSETNEIPIVKESLQTVCEAIGFDQTTTNLCLVAAIEALTNVIRHAYNDESGNKIHVKIDREGDTLKIIIRDYAMKVDIDRIKSRDLGDIKPGGLGVHLIHQIMDHVEHCNILGGNELRMTKRLQREDHGNEN